jgi:hypothetical protein
MNRIVTLAALALLSSSLSVPRLGHAATAAKPAPQTSAPAKSKLAKPYSLVVGEVVASNVSELITNFQMVRMPVLAAYDKDEDKIGILLFGESAGVDDAKQVLSAFRSTALEPIREFIKYVQEIELTEEDFVLVYYDRNKNEPVLEWRDGEYKMH